MQFKLTFVLAAVALCAVQAANVNLNERQRRDASSFIDEALSFFGSVKAQIESAASENIAKITTAFENAESSVISTVNSLMSKLDDSIDISSILELIESNLESCSSSAAIQSEASQIQASLLTCFEDDLTKLNSIISSISSLTDETSEAETLIQSAISSCTVDSGETLSVALLESCATALAAVLESGDLVAIPTTIVTDATEAYSIVEDIKTNAATCVASTLVSSTTSLEQLAASVSECVASGVASEEVASIISAASDQLSKIINAISNLG